MMLSKPQTADAKKRMAVEASAGRTKVVPEQDLTNPIRGAYLSLNRVMTLLVRSHPSSLSS